MPDAVEHYCTLFDHSFLSFGLLLHRSLTERAAPFHLWILCMDRDVEDALRELALPNVSLMPLRDVENDRLRGIKGSRTGQEYCWTLTPFVCEAVMARTNVPSRVTYLDADLYFFANPKPFFDELAASGKSVLITEHAFAPEYDQTRSAGRFCVQFMTFSRDQAGMRVMGWWQDRCIEWCFARLEDGKYGDQMYLDRWPELFPDAVHVLEQRSRALAPWNVRHYLVEHGPDEPVFFHFHGFRRLSARWLRMYSGYRVGGPAQRLYREYRENFRAVTKMLVGVGQAPRRLPAPLGARGMFQLLISFARRSSRLARI